jgi:DNA-binding SARP family transcriptional activator
MAGARTIRLLGRPVAEGETVRGNKPWAITAYLALAHGPVTRDRLTTLLFEHADDPANALRWNLTQVRRLIGRPDSLLGDLLSLPRDTGLTFDVDVITAGRWPDAMELPHLGDELLEGMHFASCPTFDTWLLGQRRRLAATTETMLYEAVLSALSTDQLSDAVRLAHQLVRLNPLADSNQELLIRAYAMSGDAVTARRQLEATVRLFRRELGCDPQPSVFVAAETIPVKTSGPPSPARVRALLDAGQAQVVAGTVEAAIHVMRTACEEAHRTGDAALRATAQLALGATLIDAGTVRRQDGELALHQAIDLAYESGQPAIVASAYRHLAASDVLRGAYLRAQRRLAAAEEAHHPGPSEQVELAAIRGVSLVDQGDIATAIDVFDAGLAADPDGAHPFIPIMLAHAGRAHLLAGDLTAARTRLDRSLHVARTRAWAGLTAAPLALQGHAALAAGDLDTAQALLDEAFTRACQVADPCWETWAAHGLGLHAAASGDLDSALAHLADAIARSRPQRGGHLWSRVWALTDAVRLGDRDPRRPMWLREGIETAQRCGMRTLAAALLDAVPPGSQRSHNDIDDRRTARSQATPGGTDGGVRRSPP